LQEETEIPFTSKPACSSQEMFAAVQLEICRNPCRVFRKFKIKYEKLLFLLLLCMGVIRGLSLLRGEAAWTNVLLLSNRYIYSDVNCPHSYFNFSYIFWNLQWFTCK